MEFLLAFGSAHRALKADSVLRGSSVPFRIMAAPRALEPHCELVIMVRHEALDGAIEVLRGAGLDPKTIYRKEGDEYVKV
ncbi:MAG: DUF3343 domain-containing protein [Deltaproteobacteria bacterium]|nr:DUF3343 domain-containing protein [Deltaproteobacteria bacterium]